jgi:hypothetical protein
MIGLRRKPVVLNRALTTIETPSVQNGTYFPGDVVPGTPGLAAAGPVPVCAAHCDLSDGREDARHEAG